jgi:hypothetical protein
LTDALTPVSVCNLMCSFCPKDPAAIPLLAAWHARSRWLLAAGCCRDCRRPRPAVRRRLMEGSVAQQMEALQARKTRLSEQLSGRELTDAAREVIKEEFVLLTRAMVALTRIERHSNEVEAAAASAVASVSTPMQPDAEGDDEDSDEPLE